jgi:protein O-mannosyl-transferase
MPPHASASKTKRNTRTDGRGLFDSSVTAHVLILIAITVLTYANSLQGKFVFDDQQIVLQNPALMNIHSLNDAVVLGAGWRQLLFFTYGLNYYIAGLDTFGYHVLNLVLHVANVLLVYAILLAALGQDLRARFTALSGAVVFGVHTLFSGAVSYIAGRSSELCATFYFAAILFFFAGLNSSRRNARVLYFACTGIAGLLAWQAKQEAITLPLFLAVVIFLRIEKKDWRWIAPLAAIPVVVVILVRDQLKTLYATVGGNEVLVSAGFDKVLPPATYFRTYITAVVSYFFPRFVVPLGLSADPQIETVDHWYSPEFLFAVAVFAFLVWAALRFYRKEPLLSLGIAGVLVSPLAAYAVIPLADVVLEHRGYIPGLGVAFLFAWLFQWIARNRPNLRWLALASVAISFAAMTVSRNTVFANNTALWEDAVLKAPGKTRPHFNLGQAYQDAQRLPEAIQQYQAALAIKPDIHAAYSNMAAIYLDQKQFDKGEETLLKVTSLAPTFTEGFINLAVLYIRRQEPDKALVAIAHALETNPQSFAAHYNKGEALTQKGEFKLALESYKEAVHLRPDIESFRLTLGMAYVRAGDRDSAEKEFNALTSGSVAADAFRQLGSLYSDEGRLDQAVQYLDQATRLKPVFPDAYHDLGVAYLRKQTLDAAIEQFRMVLRQQPDHGPAALNLAMAQQLKGDVPGARQTLQEFVEKYGNSSSPFVQQARQRLAGLPAPAK